MPRFATEEFISHRSRQRKGQPRCSCGAPMLTYRKKHCVDCEYALRLEMQRTLDRARRRKQS